MSAASEVYRKEDAQSCSRGGVKTLCQQGFVSAAGADVGTNLIDGHSSTRWRAWRSRRRVPTSAPSFAFFGTIEAVQYIATLMARHLRAAPKNNMGVRGLKKKGGKMDKNLAIALIKNTALTVLLSLPVTVSAAANQDDYVVLDSVKEDGSNLREVLSGIPIIKYLVPLGPNLTYFGADSGISPLLRGGILDAKLIAFQNNLPRICRSKWTEVTREKDVMTDRMAKKNRDIPSEEMKTFFARHINYGAVSASCGEAFTIKGAASSGYITRAVPQPFVWKNGDLLEPKSKDELPPDGIVQKSWFKPRGSYPSYIETVGWANRICELAGGKLMLAFHKGNGALKQIVKDVSDMANDIPSDYYLHCDAGSESFLIRKWIAKERTPLFTNPLDVPKMAVQRNRDLKSVGF